jgi:hypothetical protein
MAIVIGAMGIAGGAGAAAVFWLIAARDRHIVFER